MRSSQQIDVKAVNDVALQLANQKDQGWAYIVHPDQDQPRTQSYGPAGLMLVAFVAFVFILYLIIFRK